MEIKARSKKLADLRAFLLAQRARLLREIETSYTTTDHERAGYSTHMADDATLVYEQDKNAGLKRDHQRLLADVDDALQRMTDGTYGVCKRCGEAIDTARLRALPSASLCYDCKDRSEHR